MIDVLKSQAKALLGDIPEAAPFLHAWPEPDGLAGPSVPASLPVLGCIGDLAAGTCATGTAGVGVYARLCRLRPTSHGGRPTDLRISEPPS